MTPFPSENSPKTAELSVSSVLPLVVVDSVSKRFNLQSQRTNELRERFGSLLRKNNKARLQPVDPAANEFWALQDISFSVQAGQPVGIVGHNGSGKSTMLKLLTGIMQPTKGSIKVKGRIGALIEVGAGFHPDLTGRENVYLSGSILGLSRRDVDSRFDRIVQFANLERFIDTPVKRYSSGMYMRLGFSVAAHTDPDVLLIDEVLAVGDTLFQRKCLAYLKEFVYQGGAVVFVSHAMNQVAELCKTCVWLDHGQVRYIGDTENAIGQYMAVVSEREAEEWQRSHPEEWEMMQAERKEAEEATRKQEEAERAEATAQAERAAAHAHALMLSQAEEQSQHEAEEASRLATRMADYDRPRLLSLRLLDKEGVPRTQFSLGEAVTIRITYQFMEPPPSPVFGLEIFRADGLYMSGTSNFDHEIRYKNLPLVGEIVIQIPALVLGEGDYRLRYRQFASSTEPQWSDFPVDVVDEATRFHVNGGPLAHGCTFMPMQWKAPNPLSAPALFKRERSSNSVIVPSSQVISVSAPPSAAAPPVLTKSAGDSL